MNVFVAGGTGLVGRRLIRRLVDRGDEVFVLTRERKHAQDAGLEGERINLVKHFERRSQQNQAGGIIEREGAVALAKLAPVCPACHKPTRVGSSGEAGKKQRICRRCQGIV